MTEDETLDDIVRCVELYLNVMNLRSHMCTKYFSKRRADGLTVGARPVAVHTAATILTQHNIRNEHVVVGSSSMT